MNVEGSNSNCSAFFVENADQLSPKELGKMGEDAACKFLRHTGFDIVDRNWSCIAGEVDIVAKDDVSIHFVEVKTRRGSGKGFPEEAVNAEKRRRYERIAECYLAQCPYTDISVHFDIIGVLVFPAGTGFIRYHLNAFAQDLL